MGSLFRFFAQRHTVAVVFTVMLVLLGVGFGMFSSPNMSAIIGSVDKKYYGTASSMVATMRTVGMLMSMTIIAVVLSYFMGDASLAVANKQEFVNSLHLSMILFSLMSVVGIGFSMIRNSS